jgi:hypothetical protein
MRDAEIILLPRWPLRCGDISDWFERRGFRLDTNSRGRIVLKPWPVVRVVRESQRSSMDKWDAFARLWR